MNNNLTIAIDGPAGAGKSTIAKQLAQTYGIVYVDTGAMYRAVALYMMEHDVDIECEAEVIRAMDDAVIELSFKEGNQHLLLCGVDVTQKIREERVGNNASKVSAYLPVREKMVAMQKAMGKKTSLVMDGRDIGTHVLTDATVKIFLSADPKVRAERRYKELVAKGQKPDLSSIEMEIRERDHRDMTREHAPLMQAHDAILVDTSQMTIGDVVDTIMQLVQSR